MNDMLATLPPPVNLLLFAAAALGVWFAGARLTYLIDAISDRFALAKSVMGLLVLATATSLPEIATTLSAAVQQNKALVLNNLFGGVALQCAVLGVADFWARGALTNYPRKATHALEATLLVGLLAIVFISITLDETISFGWIGAGSILVGLAYLGTIFLLRHFDAQSDWIPVDIPDEAVIESIVVPNDLASRPSRRLLSEAALATLCILLLGTALVFLSEAVATQTGIDQGFIGATFLAAATSLPELTTSITAVRIGAYTLALSNIFGSNLIMLVLVLPADMLFFSGPILRDPGPTVMLALGFGILTTAIYLTGLIVRRKPRIGNIGIDSVLVLAVFVASLFAYYNAGSR